MKKNRMMRLASVLLVCVLMTTSVISGTFAKYTTSAEAEDTARVARWGVELAVTGGDTLFSKEYDGTDSRITVKSSDTEDVVAPGTQNTTGVTFTLNGTPEVATKVTASIGAAEDVFLKYTDELGTEQTYYPVKFTLTHTYADGAFSIKPAVAGTGAAVEATTGKDVVTGTLTQINAVLQNLTNAMTQNNPGYPYADTFNLTWAWEFGDPANNAKDTTLGNIAAGQTTGNPIESVIDSNLELKYDFSITVEQVD